MGLASLVVVNVLLVIFYIYWAATGALSKRPDGSRDWVLIILPAALFIILDIIAILFAL